MELNDGGRGRVSPLGLRKAIGFHEFAKVITGGEMFTHLRKARKFSDEVSKFYGLQVREGLSEWREARVVAPMRGVCDFVRGRLRVRVLPLEEHHSP